MSDLCPICYVNNVSNDNALKCGFMTCGECLTNWVKEECRYEFIKVGNPTRSIDDAISKQEKKNYSTIIETIKWMNSNCQVDGPGLVDDEQPVKIEHRLTYEEWLDFIQKSDNQSHKDEYAEMLFNVMNTESKTLRKWPRQSWDYVGYINPRDKWSERLECEKCDYTWNDPALEPFWKKLRKWLWGFNLNLNLFNQFQKVCRSQACPGCGIWIIKGPGCKHMNCQKCRHEFWWYWLGAYPSYRHVNVPFCPMRIILKVLIYLYLITLTINLQLSVRFPAYQSAMILIATNVGIWLLANLMTLAVFLVVTFGVLFAELRGESNWCINICEYLAWFFMIFWVPIWVTGWVFAYMYWPLAKKMAIILMWQYIGIVWSITIVTAVTWIVKCIHNKIERRRYSQFNYQNNQYPGEMGVYDEGPFPQNPLLDNTNDSILTDHQDQNQMINQSEDTNAADLRSKILEMIKNMSKFTIYPNIHFYRRSRKSWWSNMKTLRNKRREQGRKQGGVIYFYNYWIYSKR